MPTVEEFSTLEEFLALREEWDHLAEEVAGASPFFCFDWFLACLECYGRDKQPHVLRVKTASGLLGFAPLWAEEQTVRGIAVKQITFIRCPDSPAVDFLLRDQHRLAALEAIFEHLFSKSTTTWDLISLTQWPAASKNREAVQDILNAGRTRFYQGLSTWTPYVAIEGPWEEFLKTRSVKFRKTHRNVVNRVGRLDNVDIRVVRQDVDGSALKALQTVCERGWKHQQRIAIPSSEASRAFFARLTDWAGNRGCLLLWLLMSNGTPIAMEYDLEHAGEVYGLRADFDEGFREYSPGTYLEYQLLKHLFDERYRVYNAGPGLDDYKLHWTRAKRENVTINVCNGSVKGTWLWLLEQLLLPGARWARHQANRVTGPRAESN